MQACLAKPYSLCSTAQAMGYSSMACSATSSITLSVCMYVCTISMLHKPLCHDMWPQHQEELVERLSRQTDELRSASTHTVRRHRAAAVIAWLMPFSYLASTGGQCGNDRPEIKQGKAHTHTDAHTERAYITRTVMGHISIMDHFCWPFFLLIWGMGCL